MISSKPPSHVKSNKNPNFYSPKKEWKTISEWNWLHSINTWRWSIPSLSIWVDEFWSIVSWVDDLPSTLLQIALDCRKFRSLIKDWNWVFRFHYLLFQDIKNQWTFYKTHNKRVKIVEIKRTRNPDSRSGLSRQGDWWMGRFSLCFPLGRKSLPKMIFDLTLFSF